MLRTKIITCLTREADAGISQDGSMHLIFPRGIDPTFHAVQTPDQITSQPRTAKQNLTGRAAGSLLVRKKSRRERHA